MAEALTPFILMSVLMQWDLTTEVVTGFLRLSVLNITLDKNLTESLQMLV